MNNPYIEIDPKSLFYGLKDFIEKTQQETRFTLFTDLELEIDYRPDQNNGSGYVVLRMKTTEGRSYSLRFEQNEDMKNSKMDFVEYDGLDYDGEARPYFLTLCSWNGAMLLRSILSPLESMNYLPLASEDEITERLGEDIGYILLYLVHTMAFAVCRRSKTLNYGVFVEGYLDNMEDEDEE